MKTRTGTELADGGVQKGQKVSRKNILGSSGEEGWPLGPLGPTFS